jgi:ATP-dependent protease HslVU (ClpYQ) peptidase subunit
MTTIAWDGKVLASDSRTTWGTTPVDGSTRKIFVAHHPKGKLLVGCSGVEEEANAVWQWMTGRTDVEPTVTDLRIMAVDEAGRVFVGSKPGRWSCVGRRKWAIGSGCDYALGAMAAGASARQAVRIAATLDTGTGPDVYTLTLKSKATR